MPTIPNLKPLIISAPFGNYVQPSGATATLGTFTALRRPGRLWRILKTVRYYRRLNAWVNKIGLRNPGIDWLVSKVEAGKIDVSDKIVSIHGFDDAQWAKLVEQIARIKPMAVELNMSCPNVGEIDWPADLFPSAVATGVPVIAKLPPVNFELMAEKGVEAGVRYFHCCNTLPVPAGGMSGRPLKPVSLQCIRWMRQRWSADEVSIIGGGGIREPQDIDDYISEGVQHVAIGTRTMNPVVLVSDSRLRPLIDHARAKLG